MDRYEIITILVLILASVPILYALGVFVWGYLCYRREERLPKPRIVHPEMGPMVCDRGVWSGTAQTDEGPVRFYVSGGDSGPDQQELVTVQRVLGSLDSHRQAALEYLVRSEETYEFELAVSPGAFKLEAVDSLPPSGFCLEFELDGDPDGVWRVEFKDGQPVFSGRDD